jgi:predicted kinase
MKELVILVGPPGSGKTTYSKAFLPNHLHLSTDYGAIKQKFKDGLATGKDIVIDRMNPTKKQRAEYIKPAIEAGYHVRAVMFNTPKLECRRRLVLRKDHPTLDNRSIPRLHMVLAYFYKEFEEVDEIPVTFVEPENLSTDPDAP